MKCLSPIEARRWQDALLRQWVVEGALDLELRDLYVRFMGFDLYCLGIGRHRTAYKLQGPYVAKVPNSTWGLTDNEEEAHAYLIGKAQRWLGGNYFAACRMLGYVLIMEYVEHADLPYVDLPSWVYAVDCKQVGYTADGRLVAYDYA